MGGLDYLAPYILWSDGLKKAACIFAGLGHMQPLLLATTNSHYLLDRFCMERCCSSDYISRIVTSLIFMEILSIIVVRLILYVACYSENWSNTGALVSWTRHKEEPYRDYISTVILWAISLGYLQILCAFIYGGKKGHMHWFYSSLLIQHFLNSLIAGSIGFWDVGLALWYLVTLPMGPIVVFFYQLMIHSWIRSHGPRDVEYLVVECQILLALFLSGIATVCWTIGYVIPHIPYKEAALNLTTVNPGNNITKTTITDLTLATIPATTGNLDLNQTTKSATISATNGTVKVTIRSITVTLSSGANPPNPVTVYPAKTVEVNNSGQSATVKATVDTEKKSVTIEVVNSGYSETRTVSRTDVKISKITLALASSSTNIKVAYATASGQTVPAPVKVTGISCYPYNGHYISNVKNTNLWNSTWDGGKCYYAEFVEYYNSSTGGALLKLHIIGGGSPGIKYYGTKDGIAGSSDWKIITSDADFKRYVKELETTGSIERIDGTDSQDPNKDSNTDFTKVLCEGWSWQYIFTWTSNKPTPTWVPLIMQGLSVGAVGSIFPNLIPKTLVCPKTTRNLSVINMFLVTVPHICNVLLAENNPGSSWFPGVPWDEYPGDIWAWSLLYYLIYALAILFAIFNIHYPEWALSCFLRNNTWFVFLMILFTDVLNETFNAISRAGICSQKSAVGGKKNHPCLHNKIHCLMNLTYIPFWMTTTPMMKSYVSSLDPFLCDKDRDHWPTARYGRLRSFGYWCKCGLRGLYTSPRKLITLDMRKALTRKDPKVYFLVTHDIPPED